MVAELAALAVAILAFAAEWIHYQKVRKIGPLAFGPGRGASPVGLAAPFLRVAAFGALTWGLTTLLLMPPKVHKIGEIPEGDYRHLLLVLDVSPSMRLEDAGPTHKQSRRKRVAELLYSFFDRSPIEIYKLSVVATYTEAKPVVVDTRDMEIVRNILNELPMEYAFRSGPTNLFSGLEEAAKIAKPWNPRSTLIMVMSDGDSIPPTGMPKMPDSVADVLIVGVGDPTTGKFIGGHQSRQDASSLRQMATRLRGTYHNGNEKHLGTDLVTSLTKVPDKSVFEKLTKREYALISVAMGGGIFAFLPILLHWFGTDWVPGVRVLRRQRRRSAPALPQAV